MKDLDVAISHPSSPGRGHSVLVKILIITRRHAAYCVHRVTCLCNLTLSALHSEVIFQFLTANFYFFDATYTCSTYATCRL